LSGGFYNLYNRNWAPQCSPIYIEALGSSAAAASPSVSQGSDGQVVATTAVSQMSDGQVIATTGTVVGQISDGQIQNSIAGTATSMPAAVSQETDGQVFASPASTVAVQQISDGQIIATPQASAPAVTENTDGQPVAPIATSAPAAAVSQKSDGQVVAVPTSSATAPSAKVTPFTGASTQNSMSIMSGTIAFVAGLFVLLL
jgi:hypothetical protein